MRIVKININRFAAVKDFRLEPGQVTAVHGPNESLKTMIIDAILLTLFSQIGFPSVRNRYSEEDLAGAVVSVTMNNDMEFSLGGKGNLERRLNLPRFSARNLLVVRAGELGFHEEEGWWGSIRDNLTGFEGGLGRVEKSVREDVGLTTKRLDWMDETKKLIVELEKQRKNLSDAQASAQSVARLQVELERLNRESGECRKRLETLTGARERDRYQKAVSLIEDYSEKRSQVEKFKRYKDEDYENWLGADKRAGERHVLKESLKSAKEKLQRDIDEKRKEHDELAREIGERERRAINVFAGIEGKLRDLEVKRVEAEGASERERPMEVLAAVASAAAAFFLYFSLERGWVYLPGLVGCAVAALFLWKGRSDCRKKVSTLAQTKRELLDQARYAMPDAGEVEEIRRRLDGHQRDLDEMRGKRKRLEGEIKDREEEHRVVLDQLSRTEKEEREIAEGVWKLRETTGCSTYQELREELDGKRRLETEIESLAVNINQALEVSSQDRWQEALSRLEGYRDAQGEWNPLEYEGLHGEERSLEQSIQNVGREWQSAREIIVRAGCSTPEEVFIKLEEVTRELRNYQQRREAALAALGVLGEMAADQATIINSVIGDGPQSAQAYFERITGARYVRVCRNGDVVRAQMSDGSEFSIEQLSTGTQAQLYFALRVSLIGRIFTEPPFLLLDDPFLSADDERLSAVMDFLKELAGRGWQIIYFTVDGRVVSLLNGAEGYSSVRL